jgi:hypothetical protein
MTELTRRASAAPGEPPRASWRRPSPSASWPPRTACSASRNPSRPERRAPDSRADLGHGIARSLRSEGVMPPAPTSLGNTDRRGTEKESLSRSDSTSRTSQGSALAPSATGCRGPRHRSPSRSGDPSSTTMDDQASRHRLLVRTCSESCHRTDPTSDRRQLLPRQRRARAVGQSAHGRAPQATGRPGTCVAGSPVRLAGPLIDLWSCVLQVRVLPPERHRAWWIALPAASATRRRSGAGGS